MTDASSPGIGFPRRTIVKGAAWSLPVIAAATAVPHAVASGELALSFDRETYPLDPRAPFTSTVTAMRDGFAAPGEAVTVTVSGGLTFPDGTARYTGQTDSSGNLALPPVSAAGSAPRRRPRSAGLTAEAGVSRATAIASGPRGAPL